jgi:hypothetical protein
VTGRNMIDGVSDPVLCRQQDLKSIAPSLPKDYAGPEFFLYLNTESLRRLCWSRPVMVSARSLMTIFVNKMSVLKRTVEVRTGTVISCYIY